MAEIVLKQLRKAYGALEVVKAIDLEIRSNEFLVLVGPSGCGKSTTLRMIAGLESVTSGEIRIGDREVTNLEPRDRDIAMVFQNYALFPHFSVFDNLAFGMRLRKTSKPEIARRVHEVAQILGLSELLARRPGQLSGGQRQRVAMGRAMVRDAKVFLFDEPLSNLDAKLRIQMRSEIRKVHQRVKTTVVYVTHDQVEAMTLADRIVVMNSGQIEQVGTPDELYRHPLTQFVAGFIGSPAMNFVTCKLDQDGQGLVAALAGGPLLPIPEERHASYAPYVGRAMTFGIRPEHLTERRAHVGAAQTDFDALVETIEPTGNDTMVYLSFAGAELCARSTPQAARRPGETMSFSIDMNEMHLIDPVTERVVAIA